MNKDNLLLNLYPYCKTYSISFMYSGISIGGDCHCLGFWNPLLDRINLRLSSWKSKYISFGDRPILLKFVMYSLSIYFLSFFKAPTDSVCRSKEDEWLGVRRLREFNLSLLDKWYWRMLVYKDGLCIMC
ncbi:hypothetical protein MTR_8g015920 [Medicago truncatula]|uniref:Uncharacterized protein n=1 Tax=Medicago truncatula TaxID=3880 RepID=A0A072TXQ0_MEDTR|nr:hypothetical protein MTR_8g015920 [Medicago truncatula]